MEQSILTDFTAYWDTVITRWLTGEVDEQQQPFYQKRGELGLSFEDMPEPYWGEPQECSFVIVNYNPGGGFNRDRHTYRDCAGCPRSIVTYVQQMGYSALARQFPLLMDDTELAARGMQWVTEYGGWSWWQKKREWIEQIKTAAIEANGQQKTALAKHPFVFELCAWHSKSFNERCKDVLLDNERLKQRFCQTLQESVRQSDLKLAVCVGAKFNGFLDKLGFEIVTPMTNGKGHRCYQLYNCVNGRPEDGRILVTWVSKSRNRYQQFSKDDLDSLKELLSR